MLPLLLLACKNESVEEQQCFLAWLDDANAAEDAYYTCAEQADGDEETAVCWDDLDASSTTNFDTLSTCAGDGCVADWEACMQASPGMSCYDALDTCGGWITAGLVDDCNTDILSCGSSAGCSDDYYDCMRYAAGG